MFILNKHCLSWGCTFHCHAEDLARLCKECSRACTHLHKDTLFYLYNRIEIGRKVTSNYSNILTETLLLKCYFSCPCQGLQNVLIIFQMGLFLFCTFFAYILGTFVKVCNTCRDFRHLMSSS